MPYQQGYGNRRRRPRYRRPAKPKRYEVADMAYNAWKSARFLRGIINSEKKQIDVIVPTNQSTTATVKHLSAVAQGDTINQRNGRSILAKSIELRLRVALNASAASTVLRYVIFQDLNNTGTSPTAAQIGITTVDALRLLDGVAEKRFKILLDKRLYVGNGTAEQNNYNFFKKLDHHIRYSGTAATDEGQNTLWSLTVSNESTNVPALAGSTRIRFYDN